MDHQHHHHNDPDASAVEEFQSAPKAEPSHSMTDSIFWIGIVVALAAGLSLLFRSIIFLLKREYGISIN